MKEKTLNQKSKDNFLTYAGAVIKSRAISNVEDNLKPVHKRILFAMFENKLFADKKTMKSARVVGDVMGKYHPHGDGAVYEAMVRLGQPWKMRYPLVYVQGNVGNILGDGPAASRYTECRLSKIGELMLEDIDKNAVPFKDNYDNSLLEPVILPSKFPNILCNGSMGIAIGLSASLVPHNYNEVSDAIINRIMNPTDFSSVLNVIKGPDFPMGGIIIDGENLPNIYATGRGTIKLQAKYHLETVSGKTNIVFTEIPYLVDIEPGIIEPLKKMVIEEGYDMFDTFFNNTDEKNTEIRIVLTKGTKVEQALNILFSKTHLQQTIKINNTVLVKGEPVTLGLCALIDQYIEHRHNVIINIAQEQLTKTNHKLTVAIGLQKCLSNIDKLVSLIRNADSKNAAKIAIMQEFTLNEEQAEAVLEMKLSRLSRLDIVELNNDELELAKEVEKLKNTINSREMRNQQIVQDLKDMKTICGDKRRTEIKTIDTSIIKTDVPQTFFVYKDEFSIDLKNDPMTSVVTTNIKDIVGFTSDGNIMTEKLENLCGAFVLENKDFIICLTKKGLIKKTLISEYKTLKGKILKLKEDDELFFVGVANDEDYLLVLGQNSCASKIAIKELNTTGKLTLGTQIGIENVIDATVVEDKDFVFMIDNMNKAKKTSIKDFSENSRISKGQNIAENTIALRNIKGREEFFGITKNGKNIIIALDKLATKGKTASGATISEKNILKIV